MNWRSILIDWPVKLFNFWWTAYGLLMLVMFMAIATIMVIVLVLDLVFGIRWGW